ncbi:MAG: hypothetical protein ACRBDI_03175 [Alphaproteobacteria bacterium]
MSDDDFDDYDRLAPEEVKRSSAPPPKLGGFGAGSGRTSLFSSPKDFDIYCDRGKGINYIFHQCELNYTIDHLEYDHDTQRITVFSNDGQSLDLGAKIQWLVRPYIAKNQHIFVIRTQKGEVVDGVQVYLKVKDPEITRDMEDNTEKTLN